MCDKIAYCAKNHDPCIARTISSINKVWKGTYKTMGSCCGHGKYSTTIVVLDIKKHRYFEWFTKKTVPHTGKKHLRFYKKDGPKKSDHYYLPEVSVLLSSLVE